MGISHGYSHDISHGYGHGINNDYGQGISHDVGLSQGSIYCGVAVTEGPLLVAPAPIVHEGPILVRRPVVVAKELAPTQDHLEKIHYDRITVGKGGYISNGHGIALGIGHGYGHGISHGYGHGISHGYGHGISHGIGLSHGPIYSAIPVSKGISEKAVVYEKAAPIHGHGLYSFQSYQHPYVISQPRAIISAGHGHISGGHAHISGGHGHIADIHGGGGYKKY
ncbi:uncharacterized protein CDAR_437841 [Caerostris darwini]|uniref:Uncharacterized protein n=1 Tax=Caerostris darwini TaxID=1538125 RepID=A0AAV4NY51_9ARAC|nr:uncharacterized protein CDAR_437841 [Caerostris darwini]